MIAVLSSFIVQHIQSNERFRNGRFEFSASREVFCEYYILSCMSLFSCLLLLVLVLDVFVSVHEFVYTQTLVDVCDML